MTEDEKERLIAPMEGPNVAARQRGREISREALRAPR